ncbi:hypothetical protein TEA_008221 [Camellia sinensis var. sinensis]|uniref:Uncharacterized protein n=2 Tax=Camellia sinensis TaxID=4442 RepID=A0A4S4EB12_CAMSN|nr:hypothetical protein TEA_008221 [Camellia sinensis var. sinensis]
MGSMCVKQNRIQTKVLKSGCGRRNGGGDAVAVAGCKGRSVTVARAKGWPPTSTLYEDNKTNDEFKDEGMEEIHFSENKHGVNNIASGISQDPNKKSALTSESGDHHQELSKLESEGNERDEKFKGKKEEKLNFLDCKHGDYIITKEISPRSKRKSRTPEPAPYSVAGRLRQRHRGNGHDVELIRTTESEVKANMSQSSSIDPSVDSVAGRLRNMMCLEKFLFCQHELESSIFVVFLGEVLNVVKQCFVGLNMLCCIWVQSKVIFCNFYNAAT